MHSRRRYLLGLLSVIAVALVPVACSGGSSSSSSSSSSSVESSPIEDDSSSSSSSVDDVTDDDDEIVVSDPTTVHEMTEPGDFNIYFYRENGWGSRTYLWAWNDPVSENDNGSSYLVEMSGDTRVTLDGVPDTYRFVPFYFYFDYDYDAYADWNATEPVTLNLSGIEDIFEHLIFRSASGNYESVTVDVDSENLTEESSSDSSSYNIVVWEKGDGTAEIYYGFGDFVRAVNS